MKFSFFRITTFLTLAAISGWVGHLSSPSSSPSRKIASQISNLSISERNAPTADPRTPGLTLSPTFSLNWPKAAQVQVGFMPTHHGFWLEMKNQGRPFSIWVSHQKPETLANTFSVNRYWDENISMIGSLSEKTKNLGCREIRPYSFRCEAVSNSRPGRFTAEAMFWNSKSDLVVVQVKSAHSIEAARNLLQTLRFNPVNRLPTPGRI